MKVSSSTMRPPGPGRVPDSDLRSKRDGLFATLPGHAGVPGGLLVRHDRATVVGVHPVGDARRRAWREEVIEQLRTLTVGPKG